MTTEEKAKAYDEALKQAKKFHTPDSNNSNLKAVLELIFPELAESEDERIRKSLKDFLRDIANGTNRSMPCAEQCQTWLAYLEKQKEQKLAEWSEDIIRKAIKEVGLTQHQIDWLKSLRPQLQWKPSEEQISPATSIHLD